MCQTKELGLTLRGWACVGAMAVLCGCGGSPAASDGSARARLVGHRHVRGRPPRESLPPHAPGGVRARSTRSGCPTNGDCGCGRAKDLAEEFNCQLDHLAEADIPITAYLFDGSAWSKGHSSPENTCQGPDCCSWRLGNQVIERLSREGIRGLLHFWGGCHEPAQYERAVDSLGQQAARLLPRRRLLGRRASRESTSSWPRPLPSDWEVVAKAFQNREPGHDARGPRALGQRRLRRRSSGRLRRAQGGRRAARWPSRPTCPRRSPSSRATTTWRRDSERGGVLPAPALRRAPAGDGAHPVRERRPLAPRVRTGPRDAPTATGPGSTRSSCRTSTASRIACTRTRANRCVRPGPMPDSLLIGDFVYAPIVTPSTDTDGHRAAAGGVGRLLGRDAACCRVGSRAIPCRSDASRSSSAGAPSSRCTSSATTPATARRSQAARSRSSSIRTRRASSSFRYRPDAGSPWITFSSTVSNQRLTLTASPRLPEPAGALPHRELGRAARVRRGRRRDLDRQPGRHHGGRRHGGRCERHRRELLVLRRRRAAPDRQGRSASGFQRGHGGRSNPLRQGKPGRGGPMT